MKVGLHLRPGAAFVAIAAILACAPVSDASDPGPAAAERQATHVDSVFTIQEEIARYRAMFPDTAAALEGGAASIDELVAMFLGALERSDRSALNALAITPAEFIDLYYPHTHYVRRPYELSPALLWFQLDNAGAAGLTRALARYGGRPIETAGHRCPDDPVVQGDNRLWEGCTIAVTTAVGETTDVSLFGAILERGGRYKFLSLGNRL